MGFPFLVSGFWFRDSVNLKSAARNPHHRGAEFAEIRIFLDQKLFSQRSPRLRGESLSLRVFWFLSVCATCSITPVQSPGLVWRNNRIVGYHGVVSPSNIQ